MMTDEDRRALLAVAGRFCVFPGCDRAAEPRSSATGKSPAYCDLPEHNWMTAHHERRRLNVPRTSAEHPDRDRVIRTVYANGSGPSYREIGEVLGIAPSSIQYIVSPRDKTSAPA
jgi:hypothetical protein